MLSRRESPAPGWIELCRGGDLESEWQASEDGVYELLAAILEGDEWLNPKTKRPLKREMLQTS